MSFNLFCHKKFPQENHMASKNMSFVLVKNHSPHSFAASAYTPIHEERIRKTEGNLNFHFTRWTLAYCGYLAVVYNSG